MNESDRKINRRFSPLFVFRDFYRLLRDFPNLATRILSLCQKRLPSDWQTAFGHPLVLLETFVDPQKFRGTIYKADNWIPALQSFPRSVVRRSETKTSKLIKLKSADVEALLVRVENGALQEKDYEIIKGLIEAFVYGSGVPFHRIEKLQESMGIPLPASTQRDIARMPPTKAPTQPIGN